MNMNPLLTILHPRRIPEVVESLNTIDTYDKLYISYYRSRDAHLIAVNYLKEHKEYTHLVLIADDIVFPKWYIDNMALEIGDLMVLGCPCNLDVTERGKSVYAICLNDLPDKNRKKRIWNWIPIDKAPTEGIHTVKHQGAALFFINRKLIDDNILTLQTDAEAEIMNVNFLSIHEGCCQDLVISHQLNEAGIPSYVDFSLPVKHLKVQKGANQGLLVGKRDPCIELVRAVSDVKNKG